MLINFTVIIFAGNTCSFFLVTNNKRTLLFYRAFAEMKIIILWWMMCFSQFATPCTNIPGENARMHYNSATCNAKPLCLSAIVNVRLSLLFFFSTRTYALYTYGVATRENDESGVEIRWQSRAFRRSPFTLKTYTLSTFRRSRTTRKIRGNY